MRSLISLLFASHLALGLVGGCAPDSGATCQAGTIGCECVQGTCDVGLVCSDNTCLGPGGDGDGDGDGDGGVEQAAECAEYISCVAAAAPETLDQVEQGFGPDSPCWDSEETAESCAAECAESHAALAELAPDEPACNEGNGTTGGECEPTGCDPDNGGAECECMACVGDCLLEVSAPCEGVCMGECQGDCVDCGGTCQQDGNTVTNCAGACDGECIGVCVLEDPALCYGQCLGSCCE